MRTLLLILLCAPLWASGQDLSITATDAGYYHVILGADTVSSHATERKAIQSAYQTSELWPGRIVYVRRAYELRITREWGEVYDVQWSLAEGPDFTSVSVSFATSADTAWVEGRCITGSSGSYPFVAGMPIADGRARIAKQVPTRCPELILIDLHAAGRGDTTVVREYIDPRQP